MTYAEIAHEAQGKMGPCHACPVCDGRACTNHIPGPGAKGTGNVSTRNYEAWCTFRLNMDTLHASFVPDLTTEFLGRTLSLPVMVGPVGDVQRHYGTAFDDVTYNECVLTAAASAGTVAFTGDGLRPEVVEGAASLIGRLGGAGIPTIKPWAADVVRQKLDLVRAADPVAIAMDVDAAGLPFLKDQDPPAGFKSVKELASIISDCDQPFIVKGVMSASGAEKAVKAGAAAVVVSNHGGRVLDGVPSTAEVLPDVVDAVGDDVAVLVDGGIRSGTDVFRALALGADAVLLARPFVVAAYGNGQQGVRDLISVLSDELADVMGMCGAASIDDIDEDMLTW
ncbi:MAG: alpha-hydroxy-acid oxidizing protein [Atopobiaceae bacterium]|jgi:hypothetical protein|nr:alpha-hydroxy-acid oxidizing protein [Atopobiaceae bacterium]MCH4180029.1 alpha-hydroxy-acid oxidizing protein [Atopobiaceae bacterium]MCH4213919.1 alpha-hydroxy-acid oxidizing protein [Atopobiaceae bacterium]MCH4229831.1 alpha-hydroxy-acid oxidizing protein [Atopobiaceae bacterium]MCH4275618.1 alpha-hydroxy-acid oxidizing protein [Atopobiaceae bacterium]